MHTKIIKNVLAKALILLTLLQLAAIYFGHFI
jgi:hypothetical protein